MPNVRQPRAGSMQYWPRKRAKRAFARVRSTPKAEGEGLLSFAGYKVGMTHVMAIEASKHSHLKGEERSIPVTIVECPPLKIAFIRLYKKKLGSLVPEKELFVGSKDKSLSKKINLPKKADTKIDSLKAEDYDDVRIVVYTQPGATGIGKKKPELFEISLAGNVASKLEFAKKNMNADLPLSVFFKEGDIVDFKAVTKGKGFQGPVRRFGVSLRQSKSEKSIRNPGSLGPWSAQGHIMYRVAHAGKMGYHQRTDYNKLIMKISKESITPKGGFPSYGVVRNEYLLVKGSIHGQKKRLLIFQKAIRSLKPQALPTITSVSMEEKQGN